MILSSGSGLFRSLSTVSSLQYQSQVAMAQLQEYCLDANGGIAQSGSTTYLTVYEDDSSGKVYRLTYDSANQTLLFDEGTVTADQSAKSLTYSYHTSQVTLCSHVSAFSLTVNSKNNAAESLSISMTLSKNGKNFDSNQIFSLRNTPALVTAESGIEEALLTKVWFADYDPGSFTYTYSTVTSGLIS